MCELTKRSEDVRIAVTGVGGVWQVWAPSAVVCAGSVCVCASRWRRWRETGGREGRSGSTAAQGVGGGLCVCVCVCVCVWWAVCWRGERSEEVG